MKSFRLFSIVLIIASSLVLSACSTKKNNPKSPLSPGYLSEQDLNSQLDARYGMGNIPAAEGEGLFRTVNFGYDSSQIDDLARQNIEYNVEILRANPSVNIVLEGHCDERGTAEYNLALGEDRATAVRSVLESYGIAGSRMKTISYGEEIPSDPGHTESAWSKNRRVNFAPFK